MNNKGVQKYALVFVVLLLIILSIYFVLGATWQILHSATGVTTPVRIVEDVEQTINITINGTSISGFGNVSQLNITVPDSFTVRGGQINGTSVSTAVFTNRTQAVSWTLATKLLNSTSLNSTFWFNATPGTYGSYDVNITLFNESNGGVQTLLTYDVNDTTTAPNVTIVTNANYNETASTITVRNYGNYSGNLNVNITINDSYGFISRVYFNLSNKTGQSVIINNSGHLLAGTTSYNQGVFNVTWPASFFDPATKRTYKLFNTSDSGGIVWNITIDTTKLSDGVYKLHVIANDTNSNMNNSEAMNITIDNTAPIRINDLSSYIISGRNWTGSYNVTLNVTTASSGLGNVSSVIFNFTNSSGGQNVSYTAFKMHTIAGTAVNITNNVTWVAGLNTTDLADGKYNLTVHAIDFAGNSNSTLKINNIIIDRSGPGVTLTRSSSSTRYSLVIDVAISDSLTSINKSCTSDRDALTGLVWSGGADTSQTITDSSLNCGTSYTYIVSCTDELGNPATTSATSYSTSSCAGNEETSSGGGGGGGGTTSWSNTFVGNEVELSDKGNVYQDLGKSERIKLMVDTEIHYVGVKSITVSTATVEVSSTPQTATLSIGNTRKFDLDADKRYDVLVTLNSITSGKANLLIKSIDEIVTEESELEQGSAGEAAGETAIQEGPLPEQGKANLTWLWVLIIVVVVVAIAWIIYANKKRR
ncbi:hypothetical protein J4229_03225 [Candidatus Pacearchaeota archaeon]|nr:hypothetical protein [Candidatus Pacearchaeota archaeon]